MLEYASVFLITTKITQNKIIAAIVIVIILIAIGVYYSRRSRA